MTYVSPPAELAISYANDLFQRTSDATAAQELLSTLPIRALRGIADLCWVDAETPYGALVGKAVLIRRLVADRHCFVGDECDTITC